MLESTPGPFGIALKLEEDRVGVVLFGDSTHIAERLVEALKQRQFEPLSIEEQIVIFYAGTRGFLDTHAFRRALFCTGEEPRRCTSTCRSKAYPTEE